MSEDESTMPSTGNDPMDFLTPSEPTEFLGDSWERWPDEEARWYEMFYTHYLLLGPDRNLKAAYRSYRRSQEDEKWEKTGQKVHNSIRLWRENAKIWMWQSRADDFDERQREKDLKLWEERRKQQREREWTTSSKLLHEADAALARMEELRAKAQQAEAGKGRVQPQVLKAHEVTKFVETGSKVGRLAAEMATDHTVRVDVKARVEELRKNRWDAVAPALRQVLEDPEPNIIEGEVVDEPPVDASGIADAAT